MVYSLLLSLSSGEAERGILSYQEVHQLVAFRTRPVFLCPSEQVAGQLILSRLEI